MDVSSSRFGSRRRARWTAAAVVLGAALSLAGLLLMPFLARASSAVKEISEITSAEDYQSVSVTFSVGAFTTQSADPAAGTGELEASDFELTGAPAGVGIASVSPVGGTANRGWTVAFTGAVTPHATSIAVKANEIFESDGTAFPAQTSAVPLPGSALTQLLTGLKGLQIPLSEEDEPANKIAEVANLPLAGEFFTNLSGSGADAAPEPRGLTELLDGLTAISAEADDSEAKLEAALENLNGVADAQFGSGGLTLGFDKTQVAAANPDLSGAAGADSLGLAVSGTPDLGLRLDGALRAVPSNGTFTLDGSVVPFQIVLNGTSPVDLEGALGFVGITAPDASVTYTDTRVAVDIKCPDANPCAPAASTTVVDVAGGTASLDIPRVDFLHGDGETGGTGSSSLKAIELDWTNLADLDADNAVTAAHNLGGFENFANVDIDRTTASLQFLSAWFAKAESYAALGADLPVIGGKLGEQTRVAAALASRVQAALDSIETEVEQNGTEITAQELVGHLCEQNLVAVSGGCAAGLDPLHISSDRVEYTIDLGEILRAEGTGEEDIAPATKLGLAIGDALEELNLSEVMDDPGTNADDLTLKATGALSFTLGLDVRPDSTLMSAFGLQANDFDDDGVVNADDPDADGDGRADAAADEDDDGDGLPENYALKQLDLCKAIAGLKGMGTEEFAELNGFKLAKDPEDENDPEVTQAQRDTRAQACDNLAAEGKQVQFREGNAAPFTYTLTATDVCFAGASLFLVQDGTLADPRGAMLSTFRGYNAYGGDAACATAIANGAGTFVFDDKRELGSPVRLAHRAYIDESDDAVLSAGAKLAGTALRLGGRLGFLDLAMLGSVDAQPSVELNLVDSNTGADDGRISLVELAKAADSGNLGSVLDLDVDGTLVAHFVLDNPAGLDDPVHLDVVGDFSALDNAADDIFVFHSEHLEDDDGLAGDRIHVGQDLGQALNFGDVSTAQVRQLVRQFAEAMVAMAGSSALDKEVPFVGLRPAEMLDFAKKWKLVGEQTLAADPETLTALNQALKGALASQELPTAIDFDIDSRDFVIELNADSSLARSYPFSFDLDGFPIAPADGGAVVNASAALDFAPALGLRFGNPAAGDEIAKGDLFVQNPDLSIVTKLSGSVLGTVNLGPVVSGIQGALKDTTATLGLNVVTGSDNRIPLPKLLAGGNVFDVDFGGAVDLKFELTNPRGSFTVKGNLEDGLQVITEGLDFSTLRIDIDSLLDGIVESTRFVSRIVASSDDLNVELPIIGDALEGAAALGTKMTSVADKIKTLRQSNSDPAVILGKLQDELRTALNCPACATVTTTYTPGQPQSFNTVEAVDINLGIGEKVGPIGDSLSGGIGIDGVFEADLTVNGAYEYGYEAGLHLGIDREGGFFLEGLNGGNLLELFAGLNATNINAEVDLFGVKVAKVTNGSAHITGGLGSGNAAGFAVSVPRLSLREISNRGSDVDQLIDAGFDINVLADLPMKTADNIAGVPLPTLTVPLHFDWAIQGTTLGKPNLSLGTASNQIRLSAESVLGSCTGDDCLGVIAPVWKELGTYNPLSKDPIKTVLKTEIPVLEQNFMELAASLGVDGMRFLDFLVSLDGTVPSFPAGASEIRLGYVQVLPEFEVFQNTKPWQCQAEKLVETIELVFVNLFELPKCPAGAGAAPETLEPTDTDDFGESEPLYSLASPVPFEIDIPILQNPAQAMTLLLGPDVAPAMTLIEVRIGNGDIPLNIGPQINFSVSLFDLDIGFLKGGLKVAFAGGLGAQFRLGIGYDTTGLRPGRSLIDGFYLRDFRNSAGTDVHEISAGGFVAGTIDGHFSVAGDIASVRFRGSAGINLTAGLDFFDESVAIPVAERGDGRFHLYEMAKVMEAHNFPGFDEPDYDLMVDGVELDDVLCIFRPGVNFSAYLSFSGKAKVMGVTVFNETWSENFPIIDEHAECELKYRVAQIIDGQLVLNAGPQFAQARFDDGRDIAEKFSIRRDGAYVFVRGLEALGGADYPELRFRAADVKRGIVGDLGNGDDRVEIAGPTPLDLPLNISGGPGNDVLFASNVGSRLDGGNGDDTLAGGVGNDTLLGGDGTDRLDGGAGDDVLEGGAGNDFYLFGNAWGNERLDDPLGDDRLDFSTVGTSLTGNSAFGEGTITTAGGSLSYFERDIDRILAGSVGDNFAFKSGSPSGLRFDGGGGGDVTTVHISGKDRTLHIEDSVPGAGDVLNVVGSASDDTFLLRGQPRPLSASNAHLAVDKKLTEAIDPDRATVGFVASITKASKVDRVNHTEAIERLNVEGGVGDDMFALDDNAATEMTTVNGGKGEDKFQVGQIFGDARTLRYDTGAPVNPADLCRGDLDNLEPVSCIGLRDGSVGIDSADDWFATRDTTRGFLSNGITRPAVLNGGADDDFFQVYSNQAKLDMFGHAGDDTFILRAFALEGSVSDAVLSSLGAQTDLDLGDGADHVEYAKNAPVTIRGGTGFDTMMLVGTEFQDGILVSNGTAQICTVANLKAGTLNNDCSFKNIDYDEIESIGIQALGGNDLILLLSTGVPGAPPEDRTQTKVYGGEHDDVIFIGRDPANKQFGHGGDLTGIQDPVTVYGESDPLFDEDIAPAITLPGETAGAAEPPSPLAGGTSFGDVGIIDGTAHNAGVTGAVNEVQEDNVEVLNLTGFGMGTGATIEGHALHGGVVFNAIDFVDVRLGTGSDTFTVEATDDVRRDTNGDDELDDIPGFLTTNPLSCQEGSTVPCTPAKLFYGAEVPPLRIQGNDGNDTINLKKADAAVRVLGGTGDDTVSLGSLMPAKPGLLETFGALIDVQGEAGNDTLRLDDSADTENEALDIRQASVHGLGLHPLGTTYSSMETLDVEMGAGSEVANVLGTSAATTIHGNDGDERYYVSDDADLRPDTSTEHLRGTLDDVEGTLRLHAGAGRHLLMVSDEDAGAGDAAGLITATTITGLAPASITYETAGTWADGVTVWASQQDDTITLDGTHRADGVRTVSTLNAGAGEDTITVDLASAVDDFTVVNGEEGDDVINGVTSTLPLVLFGGTGGDEIDGGSSADLVLGDRGVVRYGAAGQTVVGNGGIGDRTDGVARDLERIESRALGTGGADTIRTGTGADVAFGGAGGDNVDSGSDDDVVLGDTGRYDRALPAPQYRSVGHDDLVGDGDVITLGSGRDFVLGQHGDDTIDAGDGDDLVTGGHNLADGVDGRDTVNGGAGRDVIAGDNAVVNAGIPVQLFELALAGGPSISAATGDADVLHGDDGPDVLFGQAGGDAVTGGAGDDDIEGNAGSDTIGGGPGQDNIAGGGSADDGIIVSGRVGTGLLDVGDTIDGGDDADVIGGDNVRTLRVSTPGGAPVADTANGAFLRDVRLFDVEIVGGPPAANGTGGPDTIHGGAGDDLAFGQGDPDTINGDAGDDVLEGNAGADTILGGADSDDVLGGGSANDGVIDADRIGTGLLDGGDRIAGDSRLTAGGDDGDGHDVVLGDNGRIDRPRTSDGQWTRLSPPPGATYANRVLRAIVNADAAAGATSGSDSIRGSGGDDDLYGQFDDGQASTLSGGCIDGETLAVRGDLLCGDAGEDAILGDQGTAVSVRAEDMSASAQRVTTDSPFIDETLYARGTVIRVVTLTPIAVGGDDVVFGGEARDTVHGGAGHDLANGGAGDDAVFGGDGGDALWGDVGHDRIYGGFGADFIDVKPRQNVSGVTDPASWSVVAPLVDRDNIKATTNESDTHYGGWDADALQADEGGAGPRPGDRLVDWQGAYNVYYVCEGAYGAGRALREFSPQMHSALQQLATGDGAVNVPTEGASGEVELALVDKGEIKHNNTPRHPDHPGHFNCESL